MLSVFIRLHILFIRLHIHLFPAPAPASQPEALTVVFQLCTPSAQRSGGVTVYSMYADLGFGYGETRRERWVWKRDAAQGFAFT